MKLDNILSSGLVPDCIIRMGIRHLLKKKLDVELALNCEEQQKRLMDFVTELKSMPIAVQTDAANEQHYEVPAAFYELALGPRRKYSSGYWTSETNTLLDSETNMLALTAKRADIQAGQSILDLGCGWGALSLYLAETYPDCQITGLSNSHSQREFIEKQCEIKDITNLKIHTGNIIDFNFNQQFDRIVSVEMFEHMKNYQLLFNKVASWMHNDSKLFVHVFTHQKIAYHFLDEGEHDWLTRYFFAGGTMPSNDLFHYFQDDLKLEQQWLVDGTHYQKTSEAWLQTMDNNIDAVSKLFKDTYGKDAKLWVMRWRIFFMACAELWGYENGRQWMVSHYLFSKR